MKIKFVEIQNFRKLKSTHIDFDDETTIFVGANNSGKTSAIVAIDYFFSSPQSLSLRDVTIDNLSKINDLGEIWERTTNDDSQSDKQSLGDLLPKMDVWLDVPIEQIHQVTHILPTLDWTGGLIGVRLQYLPENIQTIKSVYLEERARVKEVVQGLQNIKDNKDLQKMEGKFTLKLWPKNLSDFLNKRLSSYIKLSAFPLDPDKVKTPKHSVVRFQSLSDDAIPFGGNPLTELIKVHQTGAQRGLSDTGSYKNNGKDAESDETIGPGRKKKLSDQLRAYYDRHLNPKALPTIDDLEALVAIQTAENSFDKSLKLGFEKPFGELETLGYPGIANPKIDVSTEIRVQDSLNHGSAVQYNVGGDDKSLMLLPEDYAGLGFQNLISMVFDLMSYRDNWMKVGSKVASLEINKIEPIHLVLVEEPEAHLHAQVQQVFVRNAYSLLRKHSDLGKNKLFQTQLVISTHSSHVAYEADFSCLRYFKRLPPKSKQETPSTVVVNLSHLFNTPSDEQRFVAKYLKATHCDLFFSDAVIFIEGQAEKLLLPEFIKSSYPKLHRRYYSLIEVGGSHAHKFRKVIEALGIATLIIADLDSVIPTKIEDKNKKESIKNKAIAPAINSGQLTANSVLKEWHPKKSKVDDLLSLDDKGHATLSSKGALYVAFQKEVERKVDSIKLIPRTFEDALIFENPTSLQGIKGTGTTAKVRKLVAEFGVDEEALADAIFSLVQKAKKGDFALDCLMLEKDENSSGLNPPQYIAKGLRWLEQYLDENIQQSNGEI